MVRRVLMMAGLAIVVASILVTGSAFAAKGGNGNGPRAASTTASIALVETDPHFGGNVSFAVSYPAMKDMPLVRVLCFQNGQMVYQFSQWSNGAEPWVPSFALWSAPGPPTVVAWPTASPTSITSRIRARRRPA